MSLFGIGRRYYRPFKNNGFNSRMRISRFKLGRLVNDKRRYRYSTNKYIRSWY